MLIFVVGPTASGKSALGLSLARAFGGSILNCDSLQACRRLDVGSAKPTAAERALVPHLLFDVVAPGERLTAGEYRALALAALRDAVPRGPVFAVGGSGFYIQALEKGMFDVAKPSDAAMKRMRARLGVEGPAALYAELGRRDPDYAARLSPNDVYRVTRALLMMEDAGRTVTELRREFRPAPPPYPVLKLGLDPDRDELRRRIEGRTARMLADGLVDETKRLLDEGFRDWPALASVGYRETVRYLDGVVPREELPALITLKTAQLAKRQRTWFRRDRDIHWLGADPEEASRLVRAHLDRVPGPS